MQDRQQRNFSLFLILVIVFLLIFHKGKYEGLTAKDWFSEYDFLESEYESFRQCVEDYDSMSINDQIGWGGVLNYCE